MKTQLMLFANLLFVATMFFLLLNLVEAADDVRCRENERRALLEFKAGVVDEDGILSSWGNNSKECCNWRGIRCSNRTGHVIVVNLSESSLFGQVSPSLSELKHLKYLDLSYNGFSGEIPPQLGNLTNLRSLDTRKNGLLTVENLDWVSRLHLLTHLDLSYVNLTSCSDWLNQIYTLSFLTHLHLQNCSLPDQFGPIINTSFPAFNSLVVADMALNNFISPKSYNWLFNFTTTLVFLDLSTTSFPRNEIPEAIGRINSLESLSLFFCGLTGMLPDYFMNLSRLATLDLINNNLTGSLSEFLRPLATKEKNTIEVLVLDKNHLDGSLPDYLTRFPSLREISISNNNLSGSFPDKFWQVSSSLVQLDLSHNQIKGPLPDNYWQFPSSLVDLDLSYNQITGPFLTTKYHFHQVS